jgi:hypothetical protein
MDYSLFWPVFNTSLKIFDVSLNVSLLRSAGERPETPSPEISQGTSEHAYGPRR